MKKCELGASNHCDGFIHPQKTADGIVYWEHGHNGHPLVDGQVCDACNAVVVSYRLNNHPWEAAK